MQVWHAEVQSAGDRHASRASCWAINPTGAFTRFLESPLGQCASPTDHVASPQRHVTFMTLASLRWDAEGCRWKLTTRCQVSDDTECV